jgi:hypothetical protein
MNTFSCVDSLISFIVRFMFLSALLFQQNVAVCWVALLIPIQEVPGSNICLHTGHLDSFCGFTKSPQVADTFHILSRSFIH